MPGDMVAVRKVESAEGFAVERVPIPRIATDEVLVAVEAASVCGTDATIWKWKGWSRKRVRPPLTVGHELAGNVVEVGTDVENIAIGDYVSAESHVTCGVCRPCRTSQAHTCSRTSILGVDRDGVFADYVAIPESVIWHNDRDKLPPEIATMQEPFGNAVFATMEHDLRGAAVAVLGCGPVGLFAIGIARASGADRVLATDINDSRLRMAREMGAHDVHNPGAADAEETAAWLKDSTGGDGVDFVFEMSGAPSAVNAAFKGARRGGHVTLVGIPHGAIEIDVAQDLIFRNLSVLAINGRRVFESWYKTRWLLESGAVDLRPLISHELLLEDIDHAMNLLTNGQACKIILRPAPPDAGAPPDAVSRTEASPAVPG